MADVRAFTMPKWGIEMQQGTVGEWIIKEGAAFAKGDLLLLIETDKITNEVEAEAPGVLARVVVPAGETQPVGALLAVLSDGAADEDKIDAFIASFVPANTATAADQRQAVAKPEPPEGIALAQRAWEDTVGAAAANGGAIQATIDLPGKAAISRPIGDMVITRKAREETERLGLDVSSIVGSAAKGLITLQDIQQVARTAVYRAPGEAVNISLRSDTTEDHYASPFAYRVAAQYGVDLAKVTGTGPRGRISKGDVLAYKNAKLPTTSQFEVISLSGVRKVTAGRLAVSKSTIPHFYLRTNACIDRLVSVRGTANLLIPTKASIGDYLIRAVALALMKVPDVNVQVHGTNIHRFAQADISITVATDRGLVTPVLRGADRLSVHEIAAARGSLVAKALGDQLQIQDYQGGSFSFSNLGMYGVDQVDAIINPPEAAILGVGVARPVFAAGPNDIGRFESHITLSLSCDHRAIDGATGAKFLQALKQMIEDPQHLFAQAA